MTDQLTIRAHAIEDWAEKHFVDAHGVIYTALDRNTGQLLDQRFFKTFMDVSPHLSGVPSADFWSYENCGMTTGAYLQAMVFRYLVEKDPVALARARRSFNALAYIYELGKEYEEGFFPKIYGSRFSMQTSSDQYLYALMALDQYYCLAESPEKPLIRRMITEMVRFWVRHAYKFSYYNQPEIQWPLLRFPALLLLASKHSQDEIFMREYYRLVEAGLTDEPEFAYLHCKRSGQRKTTIEEQALGAWLIKSTPDCFAMDMMQYEYKLRHDSANPRASKWLDAMALMWDEARIFIAPDGKAYYSVLVDMRDGMVRGQETTGGFVSGNYIPGLTWGRSTITARVIAATCEFFPENSTMPACAKHILDSVQQCDMVDIDIAGVNDLQMVPADIKLRSNFYCGDAVSNWLWAFWRGRHGGYW